ncbi:aspartate/tyrosine/aromatic aminotransferase [Rhodoplanes sp. TEM]|uniref:Aspartate/tyrosine/aromatic aminotransferase n=1 Tax=Rhodoplanes tepidamans TaxID=200616 RepID=A0ABT5J400_RHOTP|nr:MULTISPECIES: amino acid aminotransferase [Rhodoplanes]MDC7784361.1 aspartate/tyrosine/aromatic aminotransferase [Rhodoplanes tepidamans]MDC7983375.1 aspartate/tyrosine/aromatic aminotransferase [Rhodoplanes sp. TEM]MDQ0354511.1 aromatic-amino-acid transaminase [Rhodoplanes tepidamans]
MFETLAAAPPDPILSLIGLFRDDPRPGKIDLGIGVYRDAAGHTPILRTVREAERRLYESETTKTYVGPAGDPAFCAAVAGLVFGEAHPGDRLRAVQTPGGAGALRVLAGLIARSRPGVTVWVPDPTWVNHISILADAGLPVRPHPYFDPATGGVRVDAMLDALRGAAPGDVVLLHGCCHNPTGASLTAADWDAVCDVITSRNLFPFVDLAYQGFGDGLEEDAYAVRLFARRLPEMVVAVSCSKNFGIYRERTGAAFVLATDAARAAVAHSQLVVVARITYSMPPDHGGAIVRIILADPSLTADWKAELAAMRGYVVGHREALAEAFRRRTNTDRFDFLTTHRGMFSLLGTTPEQAARLRAEHAVYIVADGRINLAGLRDDQIEPFVAAVAAVCG